MSPAANSARRAPSPPSSPLACNDWLGWRALAHHGSWLLAVSELLIPLGALAGTAQPFRCTPTHSHAPRSSPVSSLRLSPSLSHTLSLSLLLSAASCADHSHTTHALSLCRAARRRSPPTLFFVFWICSIIFVSPSSLILFLVSSYQCILKL